MTEQVATPEVESVESVTVEPTTPEAPTDPTGEEAIPAVPDVLVNAKRGSARVLARTVTSIREGLVLAWDTMRAYRLGGAEIDAKLAVSQTEEANTYRDAQEQASEAEEAAETAFQESIAPFVAVKEAELTRIAEGLKTYKDAAIASENLDGDIPTKADSEDAANDWKDLTGQLRTAQTNGKRANVEFTMTVPNPRTGSTTAGADFRPRYSAASYSKNGGTPVATKTLLVGDIAKELGVQRASFIKSMLVPLHDDRENWDKEDSGYELSFTVGPVNANEKTGEAGDTYTLSVVKAEPVGSKSD